MIETNSILDKANELKAKQKPFALVTVVRCESPTSAKPGAKAIVYENGSIQGWIGGGCAQPAVIDTVKKCNATPYVVVGHQKDLLIKTLATNLESSKDLASL